MRRFERGLTAATLVLGVLFPGIVEARDPPPKAPVVSASSASAPVAGAASARPLTPGAEAAPLPPGHPTVQPADGEDEGAPEGAPIPGMFKPPPDTAEEDPSLPAGSLVVEVRDADNQPIPNAGLVLVVLHQSVALGQNKENRPVQADASGRLRLDHLELGTGVSYWVKDLVGPATFASSPVQLTSGRGMHEVFHVYPVVRDIERGALIVVQGILYFEVKDDRVQVEQVVSLFNFGRTAYCPDNLVVRLPTGFTALTSQAQMSDQGVDTVEREGAKLRGTFAPGRHDLEFRWQLPYDGDADVTVDVGLPPHTAVMRVMAAAGRDTKLIVDGFPEAVRRTDNQGLRVLVTEKQVQRNEPISSVHVSIRGLVTPGTGRIAATMLASLTVAFGLVLGFGKKTGRGSGAKTERASLLEELEELERAHRRGDVGPKTYEKVRRQLVDAIAQTLDPTP